jgi:precorrin isomerase
MAKIDANTIDISTVDIRQLINHAALTINEFRKLKNKRSSWHFKKWEQQLASSALSALGQKPTALDIV